MHPAHSAALLSMDSSVFLQHISDAFRHVFDNPDKAGISLMQYLPEDQWRYLKEQGLLLPFLPPEWGGRPHNQFEIQEVLRIAGHYGVGVTLRTGIEGALVLQPLTEFGNEAVIRAGLDLIFRGEGGGLAITEPAVSGSAIAREMQSAYEHIGNGRIRLTARKYWQGNSQGDFLLVAAKERSNGRLGKNISLIFVPREHIRCDVLQSEGLRAVRYAVNHIDAELPADYVMSLNVGEAGSLRTFQNIFIRSRLQLIGMTHGIIEHIAETVVNYAKTAIPFVAREIHEINRRRGVSAVLYDYTCTEVTPEKPVSGQLLEANVIKALATEYTYAAAQTAQKLLGAKGFEFGHPLSTIALDIRPFTIFEGPNDMLYAEIFDQFAKPNDAEREAGVKIDKNQNLWQRLVDDSRFSGSRSAAAAEHAALAEVRAQLKHTGFGDVDALQKVFVGRILAKWFVLARCEDADTFAFLVREIRKDGLEWQDALAEPEQG
ncbi:alkylation response protein AidB-like acyl-CoA dehydrogenase [Neisseria sp. HSC-16F19]|nr:acyl-CoA dehydrogenase family protein [Neisseria sp. HSC-16F19]MCP2040269.1 alkylation response protein AidB-like acyl-CoA dehydrogenase [Neisseria sp. HSC-16F19]